jgi:hypothetical protein
LKEKKKQIIAQHQNEQKVKERDMFEKGRGESVDVKNVQRKREKKRVNEIVKRGIGAENKDVSERIMEVQMLPHQNQSHKVHEMNKNNDNNMMKKYGRGDVIRGMEIVHQERNIMEQSEIDQIKKGKLEDDGGGIRVEESPGINSKIVERGPSKSPPLYSKNVLLLLLLLIFFFFKIFIYNVSYILVCVFIID